MAETIIVYSFDGKELLNVPPIKEIEISAAATQIKGVGRENYAFKNAHETIERVTFQTNPQMASITPFCFFNCSRLSFLDISKCTKLLSIGDYAFSDCTSLKTLELPQSLESVGNYSFTHSGITELYIPKNVVTFGHHVFFHCNDLTTFTIDTLSKMTFLENHQFTNTSIKSLKLTQYIDKFNGDNFEFVESLTDLTVDPNNNNFCSVDNVVFSKNKQKLVYVISSKTGEYRIPYDIVEIVNCAFHSTKLSKVIFPPTLDRIMGWAFYGSKTLNTLELPTSCHYIGVEAFAFCTALTEIHFPEGLQTIEGRCFFGCDNLNSVSLPSTLSAIGGCSFPANLRIELHRDSSLTLDNQGVFWDKNYENLYNSISTQETIEVPNTVKVIKNRAFSDCATLRTLRLPVDSQLQTICEFAFFNSSIENINLPNGVIEIQKFAFLRCSNLREIHLGSSVTKIGEEAFRYCTNLVKLVIDPGNQIIFDNMAFQGCEQMVCTDFHQRVYSAGSYAFSCCRKIETITFSSSLNSLSSNAFELTGLTSAIFYSPTTTLTAFEVRLFYGCEQLTTINIPEGVKQIKDEALAFTAINQINLPPTCQTLFEKCFQGCKNVQYLTIPPDSQLKDIGFGVFYKCSAFKRIDCSSSNFVIENDALFNKGRTQLFVLPPDAPCRYFSFPPTLETVRISALQGCHNIHVIFLPKSVVEIQPYAFCECSNLRSINIPRQCAKVGQCAFLGCQKMQCGISIENENSQFRNDLIEVAMLLPSALNDCDVLCPTIYETFSFSLLPFLCLALYF